MVFGEVTGHFNGINGACFKSGVNLTPTQHWALIVTKPFFHPKILTVKREKAAARERTNIEHSVLKEGNM